MQCSSTQENSFKLLSLAESAHYPHTETSELGVFLRPVANQIGRTKYQSILKNIWTDECFM
jgi:hypothetical protein